jgi:hypothetical protein
MPLAYIVKARVVLLCIFKESVQRCPRIFDAPQKSGESAAAVDGYITDNKLIYAHVLGHKYTADFPLPGARECLLQTSDDIRRKYQR